MSSDHGTQVQTTESEPWDAQGNRLRQGFAQADKLFGASPEGLTGGQRAYYPGATYVPFAPETEQALDMTANRARSGSPLMTGANRLALDTINGKYVDQGNPYMDAVYNRGARSVTDQFRKSVIPSINSTFSSAGRFGSNQHREMFNQAEDSLGRTLSEMFSDMAMPTYEAERGRQVQAGMNAPNMAASDYMDADRLASVGSAREGLYEQQLGDDINRYNFTQAEPESAVARYMQLLQGNYGGTNTAITPIYRNRAAGAVGGAAAGSTFGPWGTLIGAGLGYLS